MTAPTIRLPGIGIRLTLRVVETPQGYVWADGLGFAWRKVDEHTWQVGEKVWAGDDGGIVA